MLLTLLSRFMDNRSWRLLDIINTLVFPPITYDWDTQLKEEISFEDKWKKSKKGIFIFHILYFMENIFLCVPIFILSSNINTRNIFHAQLFPLLQEERASTQMAALLGLAPVGFAVSSALQVSLMFLYYRIGHPWQAIWNLKNQKQLWNKNSVNSASNSTFQLKRLSVSHYFVRKVYVPNFRLLVHSLLVDLSGFVIVFRGDSLFRRHFYTH